MTHAITWLSYTPSGIGLERARRVSAVARIGMTGGRIMAALATLLVVLHGVAGFEVPVRKQNQTTAIGSSETDVHTSEHNPVSSREAEAVLKKNSTTRYDESTSQRLHKDSSLSSSDSPVDEQALVNIVAEHQDEPTNKLLRSTRRDQHDSAAPVEVLAIDDGGGVRADQKMLKPRSNQAQRSEDVANKTEEEVGTFQKEPQSFSSSADLRTKNKVRDGAGSSGRSRAQTATSELFLAQDEEQPVPVIISNLDYIKNIKTSSDSKDQLFSQLEDDFDNPVTSGDGSDLWDASSQGTGDSCRIWLRQAQQNSKDDCKVDGQLHARTFWQAQPPCRCEALEQVEEKVAVRRGSQTFNEKASKDSDWLTGAGFEWNNCPRLGDPLYVSKTGVISCARTTSPRSYIQDDRSSIHLLRRPGAGSFGCFAIQQWVCKYCSSRASLVQCHLKSIFLAMSLITA
ncbi:unnamed protein product [Amoebophrya sp. A120]|nr:unnamed protein product [Amoebophrya sp. A120]|eukprot:GSA120T00011505001.1